MTECNNAATINDSDDMDSACGDVINVNAECDDLQFFQPLLDTLPDVITADERKQLQSLLLHNASLFSCHEYDVGKNESHAVQSGDYWRCKTCA